MQGRLLPKYNGRYQAHPLGYWQDEFFISKEIGIDCIEFILDFNDFNHNPLIKNGGTDEIQSIIEETGVEVRSICADYFMEAPLHAKNSKLAKSSVELLIVLLNNASKLGVKDIVIPCVDQSSLSNKAEVTRFVNNLTPAIELAEKNQINLSLETDLAPEAFLRLLNLCDSKIVTVNYDIGNSAALGYDPIEELNTYGERISDIHIKDRILSGGPICLGDGSADFSTFFKKLKEFNYQGPFIMQAYRDDEGVEIFKQQLEWITPYLND